MKNLCAKTPTCPPAASRPKWTRRPVRPSLRQFAPAPTAPLLGFAVLGGVFGEGVDLAGDRLIGAAIVGPGLPRVGPRQEQLRDYFEQTRGSGFDYAYRYPGMNKVLQAAGRVIRTPRDKGVVLLIDSRFALPDYRRLMPPHGPASPLPIPPPSSPRCWKISGRRKTMPLQKIECSCPSPN